MGKAPQEAAPMPAFGISNRKTPMAAPSPEIASAISTSPPGEVKERRSDPRSSGRGRGPPRLGREGEGAVPPADDPGIDIGGRLRRLREEHGLSQRELARRAGVSNATVSLIEQNRASPSIGSLKRVLDGLPLSLAAFFALPEGPEDPVFFPAAELTEIAGRLGPHGGAPDGPEGPEGPGGSGGLISYR